MRDHGINKLKERRKKLHRHGVFHATFLENPNDMITLKKQHFQKRMELFGKKSHQYITKLIQDDLLWDWTNMFGILLL
jgi:hypothetical protein